jgi:hypothetical protein
MGGTTAPWSASGLMTPLAQMVCLLVLLDFMASLFPSSLLVSIIMILFLALVNFMIDPGIRMIINISNTLIANSNHTFRSNG